jgi:hypothetical protein
MATFPFDIFNATGQKIWHARFSKIARDDPYAKEDQDYIPINELKGLNLGHDTQKDHCNNPHYRSDDAIDPSSNHKHNATEENDTGEQLCQFHILPHFTLVG